MSEHKEELPNKLGEHRLVFASDFPFEPVVEQVITAKIGGNSDKKIGERLNINPRTVSNQFLKMKYFFGRRFNIEPQSFSQTMYQMLIRGMILQVPNGLKNLDIYEANGAWGERYKMVVDRERAAQLLSPRQTQVAGLVIKGYNIEKIAEEYTLSKDTVRIYLYGIDKTSDLEKLRKLRKQEIGIIGNIALEVGKRPHSMIEATKYLLEGGVFLQTRISQKK